MPTWIRIVLKLWLAKRSIDGILNCKVSTPLTCVACVCLCPMGGLLVFKWMLNVNYSNYTGVFTKQLSFKCPCLTSWRSMWLLHLQHRTNQLRCELMWVVWAEHFHHRRVVWRMFRAMFDGWSFTGWRVDLKAMCSEGTMSTSQFDTCFCWVHKTLNRTVAVGQ